MRTCVKTKLILLFLILAFTRDSCCQVWLRTFSSNEYDQFIYQIREDYDNGILMCANKGFPNNLNIGWIIKTDINGNVLWEKELGYGNRKWAIGGIDISQDGSVILAGVCDTLDMEWWDPFIIKLSVCGEVEWCHVFHTDNDPDYGIKIQTLPDQNYIFLVKDWDVTPSSSVWLMKLDPYGGIIWKQRYFQFDSLGYPYNETDLKVLPDGKYLVTGTCYHPVSGQTQPDWVWPMLIMTDPTGETVWEIPWGYTLPFTEQVGGEGFQSVITDHAIYSCISNYHGPAPNYAPCLIKTSLSGNPLAYHDLKHNTNFGKASTITKLSDSILLFGIWYQSGSFPQTLSVIKTDTMGTVLKETTLNHSEYIPKDATLTQDQKLLITAWDYNTAYNKYMFHLWKLNQNLDFDSIYTIPRVYDSLCPYPIVSSTLSMPPCNLTVGKEELMVDEERIRMTVYPNPGRGIIHVKLPERVRLESQTKNFTIQTTFHQWNKTLELHVFDLFGRCVLQQSIAAGSRETTLDATGWQQGMYFLRLSYSGRKVAEEKLIID